MFFLSVKQTDQTGTIHTYQTGFTLPYSDEYLLDGPNEKLLKELSTLTGGKALTSEKDTFRPLRQQSYKEQPISQWLLLAAFLLFFIEIAVRRFGLVSLIGVSLSKRMPKFMEKEAGIQTLYERNQQTADRSGSIQEKQESQSEQKQKVENKNKKRKKQEPVVTKEMREERMKRLLAAKKRKN